MHMNMRKRWSSHVAGQRLKKFRSPVYRESVINIRYRGIQKYFGLQMGEIVITVLHIWFIVEA